MKLTVGIAHHCTTLSNEIKLNYWNCPQSYSNKSQLYEFYTVLYMALNSAMKLNVILETALLPSLRNGLIDSLKFYPRE